MDLKTHAKISDLGVKILADIIPKYQTLLIGIDGCGGSGKTTFARKLSEHLPDSFIVQMDDFYDGEHIIWQRVLNEVLLKISKNEPAKYQCYDWETKQSGKYNQVKVGGIVIVEGVLSLKTELADFYDYKIWIECPREIRLTRGIHRDGEIMREKWINDWMPAEDSYVRNEKPSERADLIIWESD